MQDLKQKKLFLLDMDGTIYLEEQLFDGTLDFLEYVRQIGGRYLFLTNNSSKGVDGYLQKMRRMGIPAAATDFLTSVDATVLYLQNKRYRKIYVFGTASLLSQLKAAGLPVTDRLAEDIDCLCIGNDTELTFQKLEDACILLGRGAAFVATNPDWVCPTRYGYVPDCGAMCQMLWHATKREPLFIGKPQPDMAYLAMEKAGFSKEQTLLVGDRLYTDIACGNAAGIDTAFVLSGEGTREDVTQDSAKPTYIFENIRALYEALVKERSITA